MDRSTVRTLAGVALGVVLMVGILLAAGAYVRSIARASVALSSALSVMRTDNLSVLKTQLDEETGIRGYAATRDRLLLEPYGAGRKQFGATLRELQGEVDGLHDPELSATVRDIAVSNDAWVDAVAMPILRTRASNSRDLERVGKVLVDRMRIDVKRLNLALAIRENAANAATRDAIDRVGLLVAGAVALVALVAGIFLAMQARLAARLEQARVASEAERRRVAELRAAFLAEKRIADTLQTAFSQRALPSLPTLRFSATYVPATEETNVGGDWYDAMEIPGHRVLFAIGDVAGHGIDAAVTMNRARQAVISAALLDPDPAVVLARASRDLERQKSPMVTAIVGYADARTYEFTYAAAGHPPPVLIEPGRPPRLLDFGSVPMGVVSNPNYRTHNVQSVPGAMLVLYTDGAVEYTRDVIEGERLLLEAAAKVAEHPERDSATVIHDAIFSGRTPEDDVAILTVGFSSLPSSGVFLAGDSANAAFAGRLGKAERMAS